MNHATKLRRTSSERWLKLQNDRRKEARYSAQREAIADALKKQGRKMFKVTAPQAKFEINDAYRTPIYYEAGQWECFVEKYQDLINQAIAGVK